MNITFGLTGGICCGKSKLTKLFISKNIPMVDADVISRQVIVPNSKGFNILYDTFGKDYFNLDYSLNRKKLADLIFFDSYQRNKLNAIMQPLIKEESSKQIKKLHDSGNKIVGYDSALIIESNDFDNYKPLIVVYCSKDIQISRMIRRNKMTLEEAEARIKSQIPIEEKIKFADFLISSEGTIEETSIKAKTIIAELIKMSEN